jgi:8-oxo-dGTP pyrophosphatase MutT (NUDIX family)
LPRLTKEDIRQALSGRQKRTSEDRNLIPAAVLIPLYEKAGEYYLIFTKRTENLEYHKGQISFPGGVRQGDEEPLRVTAIRESCEEIGLNPKDVEILGELDDAATATTHFVISPFVAVIPHPYKFKANPAEVEEIIEIPVAALLDKSHFREELKLRHGKLVPEYFYEYSRWVIWGATARILKQFLEVVFGT